MPRTIIRDEIIGHRLQNIVQSYELLDGWIGFTDNIFILDSGLAFRLPWGVDCEFEATIIPASAAPIEHPQLHDAMQSAIDEVYRPRNDEDWSPDSIWLFTKLGFWISQVSSAPHGTGGAGICIKSDKPRELDALVPFWKSPEA